MDAARGLGTGGCLVKVVMKMMASRNQSRGGKILKELEAKTSRALTVREPPPLVNQTLVGKDRNQRKVERIIVLYAPIVCV